MKIFAFGLAFLAIIGGVVFFLPTKPQPIAIVFPAPAAETAMN